jgi:hypothetical protein
LFVGLAAPGSRAAQLPWHHAVSLRPALGLLALLIGIPLLGALTATLIGTTGRSRLRRRRRQQAQLRDAAAVEARLRAAMSELCPNGWRAHVILFGPEDELPPDAPGEGRARVALDWAELEADGDREAIVRRVWAATVVEALEAMVGDRRTDETLERIERAAVWPD